METTHFFQNLALLHLQGNLSLTIGMHSAETACVSIVFTPHQNESTSSSIIPLLIKGSYEELDKGFFQAITSPLQQSCELQTNMAQHQQSLREAKAKLEASKTKPKAAPAMQKDTQDHQEQQDQDQQQEQTPTRLHPEQKRKAYEQAMKKIEELNASMKYAQALELLPLVADYPEKEAELLKKTEDLRRKDQQLKAQQSLF